MQISAGHYKARWKTYPNECDLWHEEYQGYLKQRSKAACTPHQEALKLCDGESLPIALMLQYQNPLTVIVDDTHCGTHFGEDEVQCCNVTPSFL